MNLDEYTSFDAVGLADIIRKRQVSRDEVLACANAAIRAIDPEVQAIIETFPPVTPAADEAAPLYGVPFLLKDVGAGVAGVKKECGSRLAAGMSAKQTVNISRRYIDAGLAIIGRTKSPEMAFNMTTESKLHGPVLNPWDRSKSAGGSSGGAAAAVAARMVPLAEANDGGGSIRIPASCNGVVGLKPSRGRISSAPNAWEFLTGLSASLVTSRSVRDTALMLDILEGPEPGDPYPVARPNIQYSRLISGKTEPLRIALATEAWTSGIKVAPDCADAARSVAHLCESIGHHVEARTVDLGVEWSTFTEANARIWCSNIACWIDGLAQETRRPIDSTTLEATTLACYEYGKSLRASDLLAALSIFNTVSRTVGKLHERYDLLLTPTLPSPPQLLRTYDADRADMSGLEWSHFMLSGTPFTPVFNVTGQPAISLPLSWSDDGLPIGVQFGAAIGREDLLLRLANQLEQASPWSSKIPPIVARHTGT